jgi:hypothetical protein
MRRHISASKACLTADLCFEEIHVEALAGDVMEGAGGEAGPAQDVCHQPPGTTIIIYCNYCGNYKRAAGLVDKTAQSSASMICRR